MLLFIIVVDAVVDVAVVVVVFLFCQYELLRTWLD